MSTITTVKKMAEDLKFASLEKSLHDANVKMKPLLGKINAIRAEQETDKKHLEEIKHKRLKKYGIVRIKENEPLLFAHIIEFVSGDMKSLYSLLLSSMLKQFTTNMDILSKAEVKKVLKNLYDDIDYHPKVVEYKRSYVVKNRYYLQMLYSSKLLTHKIYFELRKNAGRLTSPRLHFDHGPIKIPLLKACCDNVVEDVRFLVEHYYMAKYKYIRNYGYDRINNSHDFRRIERNSNGQNLFKSQGEYVNQVGPCWDMGNISTCNVLSPCFANGHADILKYLLRIPGFDLSLTLDNGYTRLFTACLHNDTKTLELLLNHEICTEEVINSIYDNRPLTGSFIGTVLDWFLRFNGEMPRKTRKKVHALLLSKGAKRLSELPDVSSEESGSESEESGSESEESGSESEESDE